MGKVQDTINRFRNPSSNDTVPSLALLVPTQHKPAAGSFPTTAPLVAKWLVRQTTASFAANVANLTRALQHSNRLTISPSERLRTMALYEPQAQQLLPHLHARYIGMDLPHTFDSTTAFEQMNTLMQELSFGYKIALLDVLQRRGRLARKQRLPAIYQAMKHIGECGFRHSQTYQPWPEKSWRDINTLYLLAERENGEDTAIQETVSTADHHQYENSANSIRLLYAQLCAYVVSDSSHLQPLQMDTLFCSLGKNSHLLDFKKQKPINPPECVYSVALNSSQPPTDNRFCLYPDSSIIRYFSMQPLVNIELQIDTEQPISTSYDSTESSTAVSRAQQHLINQSWAGKSTRTSSRAIRNAELLTQTGLKEIHTTILLRPPAPPSNDSLPDTGTTVPPLLNNPVGNSTSASDYDAKWTLINQSDHGMGLRWTGTGNCRIRVGEAIAHNHYDEKTGELRWRIGVIRWIRYNAASNLDCGVENIASHSLAVTTRKLVKKAATGNEGEQITTELSNEEALLVNDSPNAHYPRMLLVAGQKFKLGDNLSVQAEDTILSIKLVEKIDFGSEFQCFSIRIDNSNSRESNAELANLA